MSAKELKRMINKFSDVNSNGGLKLNKLANNLRKMENTKKLTAPDVTSEQHKQEKVDYEDDDEEDEDEVSSQAGLSFGDCAEMDEDNSMNVNSSLFENNDEEDDDIEDEDEEDEDEEDDENEDDDGDEGENGYDENLANQMFQGSDVVQVTCNQTVGIMHLKKFGSGKKGKCIHVIIDPTQTTTTTTEKTEKVENG